MPRRRRGTSLDDVVAIEEALERDARLEARQRRAEAEVDAGAERNVVLEAAVQTELVRLGEDDGVTVRRTVKDTDNASFWNRDA